MSRYITIDGGTTNTRIMLCEDGTLIDAYKISAGARKGIDDASLLKKSIADGIKEILKKNSVKSCDIKKIIASGMITSEFGLYKLDHIPVPCGIAELHSSMKEVSMPEISDIPFAFIPGVKMLGDFDITDMMRGEETEIFGIDNKMCCDAVYVLPGSHSKIIKTDDCGNIVRFSTMLTGEMIASLSQYTILKDAVDLSQTETDNQYLLMGYNYALKSGINKALFKVRVLKNFFSKNAKEIYSFFLGVVLCDEISEIKNMNPKTVLIGGKSQIKNATALLLENVCDANIVCIDDEAVKHSVMKGAIRIFEYSE